MNRPVRGGLQVIPRPTGVRTGDPPPWAALRPKERHLSVAAIEARLTSAGPVVRSPREGLVDRASAVLVALYDQDGEAFVVLTRRSAAMRAHGGEVCFPGGRQDQGETLTDTARREAQEEIGLHPAAVRIFGELDHLSTITSGSFIVPFVAALPARPDLVASPSEVEAILHLPISELLDPRHFREERWDLYGAERSIWFFELVGDTVWGATAAMLRQLLGLATATLGRGDLGHP